MSICDGLEGAPGRVAKITSPKVAVNPLQFVKVGPCDLYRSAQEQLKKVEEIKKAKKEQKDDIEDWQSNLDNWKCSRRKRQEHIIERVVEVKKFELEEQERNRRRSKTFNEMLQERNTRGRKTSLPVYHNDEADDLSDLGIGCKSSDSEEMPTVDVDNNVTLNGDEEKYHSFDKTSAENDSELSECSATPQEEYTYERAIQSYVNFAETRVKSRSLKEIHNMKNDKKIVKVSPPVPHKPAHITLNKGDIFLNNVDQSNSTKSELNVTAKKLVVPKVDVNRRRELFEKIQENDETTKSQKTLHEVPTTRTIKERLSSLEKQESIETPTKEVKNNSIGSDKLVKERLQTIQTMALKQPVNKKFNEPISSLSLKDRLSNFVKFENNSAKKQPVIEPSVSIKERLNNLQTSINKEPTKTVVNNPASNFNEKLATFKEEGSSKSELYDTHRNSNYERSYSPSSDVCNNRRHFRHRSLDSLDVEHDSIGNVSFERVQSLEDLDYCRNYPPSTFSGDTDREDSGIHTADVSSSVSQADDYDLHLVTNILEDIKINHQTNTVDENNKHRLPDCSAYRSDDFQKSENNVSAHSPSMDTKIQNMVEDSSSFNSNKSLTTDTIYISQALPSIPESSCELTLNAVVYIDCANVNTLPNNGQLNCDVNLDSSHCSFNDNIEQKNTENIDKYLEHSNNLADVIVNKLDETAFHNNSLPAIQQNCKKNNYLDLNDMENEYIQECGNNAINTFLDLNNPNQSMNDLLNSDVSTSVITNEKFDETKKRETSNSSNMDELNNIVSLNQEFIASEKLQEELQNENPIIIIKEKQDEQSVTDSSEFKSNINNQENHLVEQLDSGEFMSSGCMSAEDQQDGILINMDIKEENNCVFSLSPAVLEPPKEKPPPPPVENSDEENDTKTSKKTSLWRADSTKRIKKEIRQKRSSFLGIEGSSDDSYLEPELELIKPPDMSALLAEERRMERQLYRQSVCSESDSNQESRDSGVELDHKHQDIWSHSRNDSETYGNQSTTSDEDEIMKKEREIIETLEKEEKIRKQDLGEKLAMRLRELEAEKERIEWEQLNKENARTPPQSSNMYSEENIHVTKEPSLSEDRMRLDTNFHRGNNVMKTDWYDQRSSLQDITQKEVADDDINGGVFHDEQQYRLECRKSLQDLSRVIISGNHMQKSKQNLYHRRSMPNLQENMPRRPLPPPPILPAPQLSHPNINNMSNHHCSQQMTKQTLHALSAAPRSRLISNETWQAKRKQRPDNYNYQHWLIQEAEHRRITEQQQRQTVSARRPIPSQHAYITPTNKLSNQQQYSNHWTKNPSHSPHYNTSWTNQNQTQRNHQQQKNNGKPLPDSIIQTLTQRVQHKINPDSNNNRRRKDIIANEIPHPPIQNDSAKDKMLSVSGKKRCSHCGEELGRGAAMIIESLQLFYHIDCFKCCVCCLQLGDGLMGTDVRVRNNKLHCHNCYSSDDGAKFSCV